jgi:hypothetical protein
VAVCSQFVALCRRLDLLTHAVVAIDGSKFKTVNNRAKNYTVTKVEKRTRLLRPARRPLQTRYFHGLGRTSPFRREGGKVWNRRYLAVAARSGEGPFTYRLQTPNHRALQTVVERNGFAVGGGGIA